MTALITGTTRENEPRLALERPDWLAAFALRLVLSADDDTTQVARLLDVARAERDLLVVARDQLLRADEPDALARTLAVALVQRAIARTAPSGGSGGQPVLPVDAIIVLEVQPHTYAFPAARWPCPTCGRRQATDEAARARVRNRVGPAFERFIMMCRECVTTTAPIGVLASAPAAPA